MERGFISKADYEGRRQTMIASRQALAGLEQQMFAKKSEAENARAQLASAPLPSGAQNSDAEVTVVKHNSPGCGG